MRVESLLRFSLKSSKYHCLSGSDLGNGFARQSRRRIFFEVGESIRIIGAVCSLEVIHNLLAVVLSVALSRLTVRRKRKNS